MNTFKNTFVWVFRNIKICTVTKSIFFIVAQTWLHKIQSSKMKKILMPMMPPVVNKNLRYMYTAHSFFMMMISSCPPCDSMVDNQIWKYAFPFKLWIGKDGWHDLIELKSNKTGVELPGLPHYSSGPIPKFYVGCSPAKYNGLHEFTAESSEQMVPGS